MCFSHSQNKNSLHSLKSSSLRVIFLDIENILTLHHFTRVKDPCRKFKNILDELVEYRYMYVFVVYRMVNKKGR